MLTFSLETFFEKIRPFFGNTLTQEQVLNMNALIGLGVTEVNSLEAMAYVLATVLHEAGQQMAPVTEHGKGQGHDYGKMLDMGDGPGKRVPYTTPNQLYYGRGHVQLTWRCNYVALGHLVGADLLNHPELMLTVQVSAHVAITGMAKGSFTGRKLADFFGPGHTPDPLNARKIINGLDQAELIVGYYTNFLTALQAAHQAAAPQVAVVVGTPAQVASVTEAMAAAPASGADAAAAAPDLIAAVVITPAAPAAEELLTSPALVAEASADSAEAASQA